MIIIPSYDRAKCVVTLNQFSDRLRKQTVLVVHPKEAKEYAKCGVKVYTTRIQGTGAANVKQLCLDMIRDSGEAGMLVDDDVVFLISRGFKDGKKQFANAYAGDVEERVLSILDETQRNNYILRNGTPFFNNVKERISWGRRGAYSFFIPSTLKKGPGFKGIPTMSDIKFMLECYAAGVPIGVNNHFCARQSDLVKTGGEAGCSPRSPRHRAAIEQLKRDYPAFIGVRDASKNKTHMANIGCELDLTFYANRAYREGCCK